MTLIMLEEGLNDDSYLENNVSHKWQALLDFLVFDLEILFHISKTIRSTENLEGLRVERSTFFLVVGVDDRAADGSNLIQP